MTKAIYSVGVFDEKGVIPLDKQKLNQYRALQREIPKLNKYLVKLYERLEDIPVVSGKVSKSSDDFPYIEQHVTVEMEEPKQATEIKKQIRCKEIRLEQAEMDKTEIEMFIASIPDSLDRQIFELMYLGEKRVSQSKVGEMLGYDQSSISLKIDKYLKDS